MEKKSYFYGWGALIFASVLAAYANHFQNSFHFDDFHTITDNASIRNLGNIPRFFIDCTTSSSLPTHQGYRPLVTMLSAINYAQGGLNPFWYHVSNFGLFLLVLVCFYFIQLRFYTKFFALLGCAWFGLLTANAETVNYVISRSDILSTLGIVGSFALYLQFPEKRNRYFYLTPAILGMFAKETTVMFAPALVAYHVYFDPHSKNYFWKALKKGLVPLFACSFLGAFGVYMTHHHVTGSSSRLLYFLTEPSVIIHYVVQFFFPFGLSADTDMGLVSYPWDFRIYTGISFILFLLVLIFKSAKKEAWKPVAFGLSWFLLMLLPTSSIIPFSEVTNDHRLFLPALGLVVACVCSLKNLWPLIRAKNLQTLSMAMIGLVLCGYAYGTHVRNEVWKNEKNLWQDVTEKSPRNGRAWMNYALVFMAEAKYKEAVAALLKAQALVPYYPNLYINLAIVQGETGRDPEARQNFLKAIQLNMPGELDPYYFYARYLSQRGHPEEAEGFVKQALQIFSGHLLSRQLLMEIYLQEKRKPELLNLTQETLALYPHDTESLRYLGLAKKEN